MLRDFWRISGPPLNVLALPGTGATVLVRDRHNHHFHNHHIHSHFGDDGLRRRYGSLLKDIPHVSGGDHSYHR